MLKSSPFLVEWLNNDDVKEFAKTMKNVDKQKFQRNMKNIYTLEGATQAGLVSNSAVFCSKMTEFIESYQILYNEVIENAKAINEKSQSLAATMF